MNPLIEYWDNVIKTIDWGNKSEAEKEALYNKCSELAAASSDSEKDELSDHIVQTIKGEQNESTD